MVTSCPLADDLSARQAQVHADDANASAGAAETGAAETSAAEAAASAATARNAANRADADAESAENSAANAAFSAAYARESARKADRAKEEAYASKKAAGASETEANAAAAAAWKSVQRLAEKELEEAIKQAERDRKEQEGSREKQCVSGRFFPTPCSLPIFRWIYAANTPGDPVHNAVWEITGLADIQKCITNPVAADCALAATGLLPWGKLKLLGKIDEGVEALQSARGRDDPSTALQVTVQETSEARLKAAQNGQKGLSIAYRSGKRRKNGR